MVGVERSARQVFAGCTWEARLFGEAMVRAGRGWSEVED